MRFGELAGLYVTDFDFKNATVKVQRGTFRSIEDTPKSQKGKRLVYLDARTLEAARTYLDGRGSGRVFMTRTGTPLKNGVVNRDVLKPLCGQVQVAIQVGRSMHSAMDVFLECKTMV